MNKKLVRAGLRLLGPALLVVVLARLDRAALFETLSHATPWPVVLAVLLNVVNVHLKVVRWGVLLEVRGIEYPRRRQYGAFMSSLYLGMITPGRVGDLLRVQYLRHERGVSYAEGLASVVMDRIADLYVLVVFAALGVVRFGAILAGELAVVAWISVAATVLGPLVLLIPGLAEAVGERLFRKLPGVEPTGLTTFLTALRAQARPRVLARTVPLTVAAFLVNYGQAFLMARSLGLTLSYYDAVCLLSIASLLALLPISVSGVGVRELFFALAFPVLGYGAEVGIAFGLLFFTVNHLVLILGGFVSFQLMPPPTAPSE